MAQNSMRLNWPAEEVNSRLKIIMKSIHKTCLDAAEEYNKPGDYVTGANIAGFVNVVNAMLREQEVAYILKDCETKAVLVDAVRLPIVAAVREGRRIFDNIRNTMTCVAIAFTDDDAALHRQEVERVGHGDLCRVVCPQPVAAAHEAAGGKSGSLGGAHQVEARMRRRFAPSGFVVGVEFVHVGFPS